MDRYFPESQSWNGFAPSRNPEEQRSSSGVLLNHRAVLKIPAVKSQESTVQMPLPQVSTVSQLMNMPMASPTGVARIYFRYFQPTEAR